MQIKHLGLISYERKTPLVGQSFLLIIATIMVIPESTNIASLIDYVSPLTWILASGVFASIFVFRQGVDFNPVFLEEIKVNPQKRKEKGQEGIPSSSGMFED